MHYISKNPNESGAYSNPQSNKFTDNVALSDEQLTEFLKYNGFVYLTIEGETVTAIEPNLEAWEKWKASLPNPLDDMKEQKIIKSKTDLQTYLAEHPLQWTDGKYYTITSEKQQQLTSKLLSATFAQQIGTEYDLKWNDTEQVCEPWTLENLTALAFAIDARATALVTYQQEKERQIRDAETLETLESIVVNYDEVV